MGDSGDRATAIEGAPMAGDTRSCECAEDARGPVTEIIGDSREGRFELPKIVGAGVLNE